MYIEDSVNAYYNKYKSLGIKMAFRYTEESGNAKGDNFLVVACAQLRSLVEFKKKKLIKKSFVTVFLKTNAKL